MIGLGELQSLPDVIWVLPDPVHSCTDLSLQDRLPSGLLVHVVHDTNNSGANHHDHNAYANDTIKRLLFGRRNSLNNIHFSTRLQRNLTVLPL